MNEELSTCPACGVIVPPGHAAHSSPSKCIAALQSAILKQREASERLGLAISTRMMAVLEELSLENHVQEAMENELSFKVRGPDGQIYSIPPSRFAGVFTAIRYLYEKMGDWSPLEQAKTEAEDARAQLTAESRRADTEKLRGDWEKKRADQWVEWATSVHRWLTELVKKYSFDDGDRKRVEDAGRLHLPST